MSGPWEEYQTTPQKPKLPVAKPAGPWDEYAVAPAPKVASVKDLPQVSAMDRTRAAASGINRGLFNDLLGLPVDTAANVIDLAKIAVGGGYTGIKSAISGKMEVPPEWSEPFDRSKVPGSSEWLNRGTNKIGMGAAVNNPAPQDTASRILHTGGRFAGASVIPSSRIPLSASSQLKNAGMGAVSGLTAGTVGEVAPEWAGLAGMLPGAAAAGTAAGIRRSVRGDEAGRRMMEQRISDLKNGGIETPSVGLASGNQFVTGLENLLSHTPGSVGLYQAAKNRNLSGMKGKADALRDSISSEYGPVAAGQAVQADIKGAFRDRTKATAGKLADKVASIVGRDTIVPVSASLDKARALSTPTKGAEATSGALIQPRISRIADNLETDVFGPRLDPQTLNLGNPTRNSAISSLPQLRDGAGLMNTQAVPRTVANPSIWNEPILRRDQLPQRGNASLTPGRPGDSLMNNQKPQGIPFGALKSLRTSIGEETQSNAIMGTPEQAQFKQMYGAMSQDMQQAASAADRTRAGVSTGPLTPSQQPAGVALTRANKHFSTAMNRADELNGIANRDTPEGAYGAVEQSLRSGPTTWERTRSAVTPATRQKVAATMIDEMGTATPGQQNATGTAWSPQTFLTNYSKLYENGGGQALFTRLPGGQAHAENLASIAKAAEMVGTSSKVWANPSGTSSATFARGTLGAIGGGFLIAPFVAAKAGAGVLAVNQVSKRLLLNPKFVNWLAKAPQASPAQAQSSLQRLVVDAKVWGDKQLQQDVSTYVDAMKEEGPPEN